MTIVIKQKYRQRLQSIVVAERDLYQWSVLFAERMQTMDDQYDPSHRSDHLSRVFNNLMLLAESEPVNLQVVVPAVWLHDCVPVSKSSELRPQASTLSSEQAEKWLREWGYPEDLYEDIKHAIAAHSFSADIKPKTLEAQCVQDADRLDALGAIGIARVAMVGAIHGNLYYCYDEPFPVTRKVDDNNYIVDHYYEKLLHLHKRFRTEAGKKIARSRTEIMENYLRNLADEIGAEYAAVEDAANV